MIDSGRLVLNAPAMAPMWRDPMTMRSVASDSRPSRSMALPRSVTISIFDRGADFAKSAAACPSACAASTSFCGFD